MVATKDKEDINETWTGLGKEGERGCQGTFPSQATKTKPNRQRNVERNKMLGIFCIVSDIKSHNTHTHTTHWATHIPTHTHTHLYSGVNAAKGFAWVLCLFGVCLLFQLFVVLV